MVDTGYWKKPRQYERGERQKLYLEAMINASFEDAESGGDGWVNQTSDVSEWIERHPEFKLGPRNKIFRWSDNRMPTLLNAVADRKLYVRRELNGRLSFRAANLERIYSNGQPLEDPYDPQEKLHFDCNVMRGYLPESIEDSFCALGIDW